MVTFTLVGIVGFGETDSLLGATLAGFDLPTAQTVLGKEGVVDEVDVRAADGVSPEELRDRIDDALPTGVEALTGAQVAEQGTAAVRDSMGIFTTVLLVFAGVSVFVGSFVIWNTFNVLVAQRRREVALLRAVGATRGQVLTGVLVEAGLVRYTPDRQRSRYEIDDGALTELSGAFADLIQSCCTRSACCGQRQDREETWQTRPYRPSPARR